jgi:hypothetical protein
MPPSPQLLDLSYPDPVNLVEILSLLRFHTTSDIHHNTIRSDLDVLQIMALAHQMYSRRTQFFLEAFTRATARPHGYMVIDMKQNTPNILRLRTFIETAIGFGYEVFTNTRFRLL